ncbi:hypothetical protein K458DRAFT_395690 [Lentithecium fluviatile CBS 122367]|uniref:Uncharacterized protein n=1 Tax=Lentithecium fluviatile CBS 122367 TaxID=1168545 RepID=A0A6G1III5_9PLEO|nr:hypothetical protein K458DRAFT_395690 [Lentithecium fluviatile CBS 122367]
MLMLPPGGLAPPNLRSARQAANLLPPGRKYAISLYSIYILGAAAAAAHRARALPADLSRSSVVAGTPWNGMTLLLERLPAAGVAQVLLFLKTQGAHLRTHRQCHHQSMPATDPDEQQVMASAV